MNSLIFQDAQEYTSNSIKLAHYQSIANIRLLALAFIREQRYPYIKIHLKLDSSKA